MGLPEAVNRRRNGYTMANRKRTLRQTTIPKYPETKERKTRTVINTVDELMCSGRFDRVSFVAIFFNCTLYRAPALGNRINSISRCHWNVTTHCL